MRSDTPRKISSGTLFRFATQAIARTPNPQRVAGISSPIPEDTNASGPGRRSIWLS
jgi:hypothetical protein